MPSITQAWFADHAPGKGKEIVVDGNTIGVNGIVGKGSGYNPFTLASPGDTIPVDGGVSPVSGLTFPQIMAVFENATGFSGSEALHGWTRPSANGTSMSLSAWVNFGVTTIPAWVPISNQGALINMTRIATDTTQDALWHNGNTGSTVNTNPVSFITGTEGIFDPEGPDVADSAYDAQGGATFPLDGTTNAGWVHIMFSAKLIFPTAPTTLHHNLQAQIYINDTEIYNDTQSLPDNLDTSGRIPWAVADGVSFNNIGGNWGSASAPSGDGLYGAVAEYWLDNTFIDWSNPTNRNKFHIKSLALDYYAPCDLGPTGALPTGSRPVVYLRGGPSQFKYNHADSNKVLTVMGTLIAVDAPPDPP